jgi:hypothetical protein
LKKPCPPLELPNFLDFGILQRDLHEFGEN